MILSKKAFKEWLESKQPEDIVGLAIQPCRCPLATFLKENTGVEYEVTEYDYHCTPLKDLADEVALPSWAVKFVAKMDRGGDVGKHISATQALKGL